jgi:hypothetical protein
MMKSSAKYHLFVPQHSNPDESGNTEDLSYLLPAIYDQLDKMGFTGRTVHTDREGHWTSDDGTKYQDKMTIIEIIADDSKENDTKINSLAGAIATAADQESVFAYKVPSVTVLSSDATSSRMTLPKTDIKMPPEAPESDSEGDAGLFL